MIRSFNACLPAETRRYQADSACLMPLLLPCHAVCRLHSFRRRYQAEDSRGSGLCRGESGGGLYIHASSEYINQPQAAAGSGPDAQINVAFTLVKRCFNYLICFANREAREA